MFLSPVDIAAYFDRLPPDVLNVVFNIFIAFRSSSREVSDYSHEQILQRGWQIIESVCDDHSLRAVFMDSFFSGQAGNDIELGLGLAA